LGAIAAAVDKMQSFRVIRQTSFGEQVQRKILSAATAIAPKNLIQAF